MNEDYIIKSADNKCITINGGNTPEKIGIKMISNGSQLFASNNNFLFFSDNKSDKTFHVQTENNDSGIIFENGNMNRVALVGKKGTFFDFYKLNWKISQPSEFYFNEAITQEFRNGLINNISGNNVLFQFKEDKLNFELEMLNGNIIFNNYKKLISSGDDFSVVSGKNMLNINKNKLTIDAKNIDLLVNERGISIDESITMISDNDLKMMTVNGNLEILNKNGEKILIKNSRPNGIIEFNGNKIQQKIGSNLMQVGSSKIEFLEDYVINGISDTNFLVSSGNFVVKSEEIILKGNRLELDCNNIEFGSNFRLDERVMLLNHENLRVEGKDIELKGDRIVMNYGGNKFIFEGEGFNYELGNNIFRVEQNEIKIISDGTMGITLGADRGGIKMDGEIDWVNSGSRLMESSENILKFGSITWDLKLMGNTIELRSDEIKRSSGRFMEYMKNGINWKMDNNFLGLSEKIVIKSELATIEMKNDIKLENELSSLVVDKESLFLKSSNIILKTEESNVQIQDYSIKLLMKSNFIQIDENLLLSGDKVIVNSGNSNIILSENNIILDNYSERGIYNIILKADRNLEMSGVGMDINVGNYYGKYENYYEIVKGDYEMVLSGNSYIKNTVDEFEIGGPNLLIGCIKMDDKVSIDTESFSVISGKISLSDKFEINENGIIMKLGEDHFGRIIRNEGIEFGTKYAISLVGNSVNIFSRNKVLIGNERQNINIERNYTEINGGVRVNGNQIALGWTNINMGVIDKMVFLGGDGGSILINDGVSEMDMGNLRIKVKDNWDVMGKYGKIDMDNLRLNSGNVWIGDKSKIIMGESGIEMSGKRLRFDGNMSMDIGDNFMMERSGNFFKLTDKLLSITSKNVDFNFNLDIKGEVSISPSKNLRLESTVGDIVINTQGGGLLMDGIGKTIRLNSEGDFYGRSRGMYGIVGGELRFDGGKVGVISRGELLMGGISGELVIENRMVMGMDILEMNGRRIEGLFKEDIIWKSEKYGGIGIIKEGMELISNGNMEFRAENPMGRFLLESGGKVEMLFGRNWDMNVKGRVLMEVEEDYVIGVKGMMSVIGRGLKYEGGDMGMRGVDMEMEFGRGKMRMKDYNLEGMNLRVRQVGFGEFNLETEGKMGFTNKLEGHFGRVMELNVESNSHDESLYIGSRMGGIKMEARRIIMDGEVSMERIRSERLVLDGDMEVRSVKVGGNIYMERRGISGMVREMFEMRNMDLMVDGRVEMREIRCGRIVPNDRLEVDGEMGCRRMDVRGIRVGDNLVGDCGDRRREFMVINMGDEYVWNTGIKINAGKRLGMEIDSDGVAIRTGGRLEVGGLDVYCEGGGKLEELEEEDLGRIMEDLRVEKTLDGRLRMLKTEKIDVMDLLMKLMAVVTGKINIKKNNVTTD